MATPAARLASLPKYLITSSASRKHAAIRRKTRLSSTFRSKFDLVPTPSRANQKSTIHELVQHDGTPDAYRAFVHFRANDQWYEMQDLHVTMHPQLISVSESYIQVWKAAED